MKAKKKRLLFLLAVAILLFLLIFWLNPTVFARDGLLTRLPVDDWSSGTRAPPGATTPTLTLSGSSVSAPGMYPFREKMTPFSGSLWETGNTILPSSPRDRKKLCADPLSFICTEFFLAAPAVLAVPVPLVPLLHAEISDEKIHRQICSGRQNAVHPCMLPQCGHE